MDNIIKVGHGLLISRTQSDDSKQDVWLHFAAEDGKSAMLSVAAIAERSGPIIGNALRSWASDRLNEIKATEGAVA